MAVARFWHSGHGGLSRAGPLQGSARACAQRTLRCIRAARADVQAGAQRRGRACPVCAWRAGWRRTAVAGSSASDGGAPPGRQFPAGLAGPVCRGGCPAGCRRPLRHSRL